MPGGGLVLPPLRLLLLLCAATTQVEENVGQQIFDEAVMERLGELEEDGLLIVEGQSPDEVLAGLFEAALEQNLTNVKNVQRMKLNVAEGRNTVEKYVDTWSTVLSKALDRVQKRRKERRKARKDEKEQLQEEKRAAKAAERQEELRQASMDDPLSASGVKMPPERPYTHDGREVIDAVKSGEVDSLLRLCADVPPTKSDVDDDGTTKRQRKQTGADVDYVPTGDDETSSAGGPPLHWAVGLGDTAMAAALLSKACGADVDIFNPRTGYTPLHLATAEDRPGMISVLIENGAHLDMRSNEAGMSALHLAVTRAARIPAGAASESANLSAGLRDGCAHVLLAAGASIELEDHRKLYTPLHMSAGYGSPEVAHLLLSFGASMTAEDESEQIPVQLAGHHNPNYPRRPRVRDLLVSESEDPTLTGAWLSSNGLSVLARHFDAVGLGLLEDVLALGGIEELTERMTLRKKQRKKLESLLKRGVKKEL